MATTNKVFVEKLGGTDATAFVGNAGEVFYDPTSTTLRISDGSTAGGLQLLGGGSGTESDTLQSVSTRGSTTTLGLTMAGVTTTADSTIGGHLIPDANEVWDLGNPTNKFRDLYLSSATIKMGDNTIGFAAPAANSSMMVNGEPIETVVNNTTIVQNLIDGSAWSLPGPYTNEAGAASAGVAIGQAYYDNGGTVRVRLA